jgi:hypothetical protein
MNIALGEILDDVGPNVGDAGSCDRTTIVSYINRAQRALIYRLDSKGTVWPRCLPVCGEVFALPPEFVEIRSVQINGHAAMQRDQYFEGHDGAHSRGRGNWQHYCHGRELFDLGDQWATPTLLPQIPNAHIALTASLSSDTGVVVTLQVLNRYNQWQTESIPLLADQAMNFTASDCYDVKFVSKPITTGNVNLFLVAPDNTYSLQAVYGPLVTAPTYRRKRLPKQKGWREGCVREVKIMGKLRYVPAVNDTDQLVIGNLDAIIWGVKAVTAQTIGDTDSYQKFLGLAEEELLLELRDDESEATISPIDVHLGVRFNPRRRFWR